MTLLADTTLDALLGGRVVLRQPAHGYRVAIDPVLLAAAVPMGPGTQVLDAGAGTGAAALCLAARLPEMRVEGLERDAPLLALARANAAASGLEDRVTLMPGDLMTPPEGWRTRSFDHVMTNPPFGHEADGTIPAAERRAAHLAEIPLTDWLHACLRRLRPGGSLNLIHRAAQLPAILSALEGRAGAVVVFPLWPRADAPRARRVIVQARKGARGPCAISRGLVLHEPDGRFTPAAEAVLRDGAALPL